MIRTHRMAIRTAAVLFFLAAGMLFSLEPPTAEQRARYLLDGTLAARVASAKSFGNDRVHPDLLRDFRTRLDRLKPNSLGLPNGAADDLVSPAASLISGRLGSTGVNHVFTLLIDFADYPASNSAASIQGKMFGEGEGGYPLESLRGFYRRSSYNQLDIQGSTLGWYRPAVTRAGVPMTTNGRDNLIREALLYFESQGHDFSKYDNDHDGKIDYFLVIWSGPAGEWASFWWGYFTSFSKSLIIDGKQFSGTGYSWQWEARPYPGAFSPSTAIHETGHALGLPDLYDYDDEVGLKGGLGSVDTMDGSRGDHNGFSKMLLDWLTPQVCSHGSRTVFLQPAGVFPDALIFWPKYDIAEPFTEFYMVQNRSRVGNDLRLPGDGLLVFHIDATMDAYGDFLYNNSYTDRKYIRLMEADGLEEIEQGYAANAGDYYTPGTRLDWNTSPNSKGYNGSETAYLDRILKTDLDYSCKIGYEGRRYEFRRR